MLTAASIQKMLEDYIKTPTGKKHVEEGIRTNPGLVKGNTDKMLEAVATLKEIICNFAPPAFSTGQTLANIRQMIDGVVDGPIKTGDGHTIRIGFNEDLLKRPSLSKESEGAYDILGLFTQGWSPRKDTGRVYGIWHGKPTAAKRYGEANDFIQRAVDYFMLVYADKYGVFEIDIDPLYQTWDM